MLTIQRTDSDNPDFIELDRQLDADLARRDGDEHAFYAQFNKIDRIRHAIVVSKNNIAVGIGAIRAYETESIEIKRMYVVPEHRGEGIAGSILSALENWAKELGFKTCILETGKKQPEAINLYMRSGYTVMKNYGPYANIENSVCMNKQIT